MTAADLDYANDAPRINIKPGMTVFDSKQMVDDTWIRTDGKWWYLPKN